MGWKYVTALGNKSFKTYDTYDDANEAGDFWYDVVEVPEETEEA